MFRLDSTCYRWWYKIRNYLPWKKKIIPFPIIWKPPVSLRTPTFIDELGKEEKDHFERIFKEIELFSRIHNLFPDKIEDKHWRELLEFPTRKERLNFLKFLRKNEATAEKDKRRKSRKNISSPEGTVEKQKNTSPEMLERRFIDVPFDLEHEWKIKRESRSFLRSLELKETPNFVVDCRFIPMLSKRAQNLTSLQLAYLIAENQKRSVPWPLYFVNFHPEDPVMKRCQEKHLGSLSNPRNLGVIVSDQNYTDLFKKENIVYLSPDAEETIETVDPEKTYVIGGIVDRVVEKGIPRYASLEASQVDRVKALRLPLDEFVEWKSGTQFLTLVTVMKILQLSYENGNNWKETFQRQIPTRYVRGPEEKNALSREVHQIFRAFDREVLRIAEERLGKE